MNEAMAEQDRRAGAAGTAVLVASGLTKRYEAVVALHDAAITLRAGEVMALMGDNGAGKSTLIKILAGVTKPDSGSVEINGRPVELTSPQTALDLGVETVYQDLALVDSMSARENIFLGREPLKTNPVLRVLRIVDRRRARAEARTVIGKIGAHVPSLELEVTDLSGGQRQALAIARAMLWGRKVVMLDEPTAALGVQEAAQVLRVISNLREQGIAILMISHNMTHVFEIADRVTVLRHGHVAGVRGVADTKPEELVSLITGAVSDWEPSPTSPSV